MEVVAGKKRKRTNGAQKRAGDAQSDASESSNFGFKSIHLEEDFVSLLNKWYLPIFVVVCVWKRMDRCV